MLFAALFILCASPTLAVPAVARTPSAFGHGDEPHPKCKKGYVVTDDHTCVKAP